MIDNLSDALWDAAIDLAADRGCDPGEVCWQRCIDDAYYELLDKGAK